MTLVTENLEDRLDRGELPEPQSAAQARAPQPKGSGGKLTHSLQLLFKLGLKAGVSDFHLDQGKPPCWRERKVLMIQNQIAPVSLEDLESVRQEVGAASLAGGDYSLHVFGELFRVQITAGENGSIVIRHVPNRCYSLNDIGVPEGFLDALRGRRGLLLITGPVNSGKSRTFNACIDELNQNDGRGGVIKVLGDPVEYVHTDRNWRIRHREYRRDFKDWTEELKDTLRQDTDVVAMTELRDRETMSIALTAAETGHLILATMHNATAKESISRIIDVCPDNDRNQQRAMLAQAWAGTLAQKLVPTVDGQLVAVFELLLPTTATVNLIRESKFMLLDNEIRTGKKWKMITMEESLATLVRAGRITREVARANAFNEKTLADFL